MACDHLGPAEVIELAEKDLRAREVPLDQWPARKYRHSENTPGGMWASVVIEIERRGDQWICTRLDRNPEPVKETGLVAL